MTRCRALQVDELSRELRAPREEHERAARRAERRLGEERAKLTRAAQQRAAEAGGAAAERQRELLAAVEKAEALKRSVAATEAALLRKVRTLLCRRNQGAYRAACKGSTSFGVPGQGCGCLSA